MFWRYYDAAMARLESGGDAVWAWFYHLDRDAWLVLLALVTVAGFFLLQGFGSRKDY